MSKTRDTGFLGNVIKVDNGGNISLVSGSTTLFSVSSSGAVTITGTISGSSAQSAVSSSYALTASYASNAELLDGLDSTVFTLTSSFNSASSSLDAGLKNVIARTGSFATTGSNVFYGNQTVSASMFVSGGITATGQIIAQTLNVQAVTSSVVYSSGSNVFGNDASNSQTFTGSMFVSGSCIVARVTTACFSGQVCSNTLSVAGAGVFGSSVTGTTIYGSTAICGGVVCGTCATFTGLNVNGNVSIGSSGTNDITWGTAGGIKLSRTNIGPEYALSQRWTGTLAYIDIASSTQWNGGVTILPNGGGNVGIGTTSPAANRKLTVAGGAQFTYGDNSGASFNIVPGANGQDGADFNLSYYTGTGYGPLTFTLGGSEKMRITSGGLVSINQTCGYAVFNVTGIDCAWGEGLVLNPAPNGYNGINFRLEGRTGSCVTCTWQLAKETSGSGVGELISFNKQGLTGGAAYRADAVQQWKTNGDVIFGFKVGVGTCTPASLLSIQRGSSGDNMEFIGSGASGYSDILFYNTSKVARLGYIDWSDTQMRINVEANIPMVLYTNATERMRITSCGNVGIGTTFNVTSYFATSQTGGVLQTATNISRDSTASTDSFPLAFFGSNDASNPLGLYIGMFTGATSALKQLKLQGTVIGSTPNDIVMNSDGGNVLIGTRCSDAKLTVYPAGSAYAQVINHTNATNQFFISFRYNGTAIGSIIGCNTTTNYITTSDYRLKNDLKDFNGIDIVSKLKTYDFAWKCSNSRMYGVIAHEVQDVLPYMVNGVKDGQEMQGVDYSKLTPVLVKAIQEQQCTINQLKTCLGII